MKLIVTVIPAKAGTQMFGRTPAGTTLGSRFRGNDRHGAEAASGAGDQQNANGFVRIDARQCIGNLPVLK